MAKFVLDVNLRHHYSSSVDRKLDLIMANTDALKAAAERVSSEVQEAISALEDLAAKVEAGTVQQADIDAITETLTGAASRLDTATGADDVPPVEPQV